MTNMHLEPKHLDLADEVAREHAAVVMKGRSMISHAVRAGELLLQAKAELGHGKFGEFCRSLPFSETTARNYMRLAQLDPSNRQRVADLSFRQAIKLMADTSTRGLDEGSTEATPIQPAARFPGLPTPTFMPRVGFQMTHCERVNDDYMVLYQVTPAAKGESFFHAEAIQVYDVPRPDPERQGEIQSTRKPTPDVLIEGMLQLFGLEDPAAVRWMEVPHGGQERPPFEPEDAAPYWQTDEPALHR